MDENNQAGGPVCEWLRLSFPSSPSLCRATLLPGVSQRQEGKQTEIKETLVLLAYLVNIWRKERESKGNPKILPQFITRSIPPGSPGPRGR